MSLKDKKEVKQMGITEFNAPVIGILTQSIKGNVRGDEYIATPYVKWVESGGARVVPVSHTATEEELEEIFNKINGLVLAGGHQKLYVNETVYEDVTFENGTTTRVESINTILTQYQNTVGWFIRRAERASKEEGDHFPIFGICLGHEAILLAYEPKYYTLQRLNVNLTYHAPLQFLTKVYFGNYMTTIKDNFLARISK